MVLRRKLNNLNFKLKLMNATGCNIHLKDPYSFKNLIRKYALYKLENGNKKLQFFIIKHFYLNYPDLKPF